MSLCTFRFVLAPFTSAYRTPAPVPRSKNTAPVSVSLYCSAELLPSSFTPPRGAPGPRCNATSNAINIMYVGSPLTTYLPAYGATTPARKRQHVHVVCTHLVQGPEQVVQHRLRIGWRKDVLSDEQCCICLD